MVSLSKYLNATYKPKSEQDPVVKKNNNNATHTHREKQKIRINLIQEIGKHLAWIVDPKSHFRSEKKEEYILNLTFSSAGITEWSINERDKTLPI